MSTIEKTITKTWQLLHTDTCIVQTPNCAKRLKFASGVEAPTTDTGILVKVYEATEINLNGPVWCRLPSTVRTESEKIIIIT